MDDMPRKLPKYVTVTRTKYKTVLFYFRRDKGPRTRLPDDPNSTDFEEAYAACLAGVPRPQKQTRNSSKDLKWLIERFMESGTWSALADGTRRQRGYIYKDIVETKGHTDYTQLTTKHIRLTLEDRRATPVQANNMLKALNGLFDWAVRNDHMEANPARDVERIRVKSDGFPPWTEEDAARFRMTWGVGTTQRLAFELLLHTGVRRSDVIRLGKQHLRGAILSVRTKKTGTDITVELPQAVLDIISSTKTGDLHFIVTSFGKPFTEAGFGGWFHDAALKAGVDKNSHGVRKLSATMSANSGATAHELMAQYGWASSKQAEIYTKSADRIKLGISSSRKMALGAKPKT